MQAPDKAQAFRFALVREYGGNTRYLAPYAPVGLDRRRQPVSGDWGAFPHREGRARISTRHSAASAIRVAVARPSSRSVADQ